MIEFHDVTKVYYMGVNRIEVLHGLNFKIKKGELVAIVGPSGSGKSTTMNIIGLLDHPSSGKYILNNIDISTMTSNQLAGYRNESIGFVFQSFFLLPRMTALQNVSLPLTYRDVTAAAISARAYEALAKVGLKGLEDHKPNELSGGQQQRVAIARALIGKPKLILADEPTGALDTKTGDEIMQLLIELNQKENDTIIIVTHETNIAERCLRRIVIQDGNIVEDV